MIPGQGLRAPTLVEVCRARPKNSAKCLCQTPPCVCANFGRCFPMCAQTQPMFGRNWPTAGQASPNAGQSWPNPGLSLLAEPWPSWPIWAELVPNLGTCGPNSAGLALAQPTARRAHLGETIVERCRMGHQRRRGIGTSARAQTPREQSWSSDARSDPSCDIPFGRRRLGSNLWHRFGILGPIRTTRSPKLSA